MPVAGEYGEHAVWRVVLRIEDAAFPLGINLFAAELRCLEDVSLDDWRRGRDSSAALSC